MSKEESNKLDLDFTKLSKIASSDCIPVAVQNIDTKELILVAYTNEYAMKQAFEKRRLILWSTSRQQLWEKGATSGHYFELLEAYVNCEQNSLLYLVRPYPQDKHFGICHTSNSHGDARNCFYRKISLDTMDLTNVNP